MFRPEVKNVPKFPGVYWYLQGKKVIYVGKAKNLKNRLCSYRQLARIDNKTGLMLAAADRVKYQVLESEVEAFITEARLIKLYQPKFNLILKDDRSPVYLAVTREQFPRLLILRRPDLTRPPIPVSRSYGPFSSSRTLRSILKRLRPIFPYCEQPGTGKACFYFHLQLCPGACVGRVSPAAYKKNISQISWFFLNKKKRLLSGLKREMLAAAQAQNFSRAAQIKSQLDGLTYFWQARFLPLELPKLSADQINLELQALFKFPIQRIETYDISNLSGTDPSGGMAVATNGQIDKSQYRLFNIRSLSTPNDPAMMAEMVRRRFNHPEWPFPDLIVADGSITQIKAIQKVIACLPGAQPSIRVVGIAKNPDRLVFFSGAKIVRPLLVNSAAVRLLIQLRDEAHRFGRKQHLRLRDKSLLQGPTLK